MVARHERVIIDLGTGDGRAARALADAEPGTLVIGMDAHAESMRETSRRAARSAAKGGRPNLLFVVGAAEEPPSELLGVADHVQILFPWGSLLRGVLGLDQRAARGIAALARPGGTVEALFSVTERDGIPDLGELDPGSPDARVDVIPTGLYRTSQRRVTADEVRATRSTWGRRLLAPGSERPVWRLQFRAERGTTEADGRRQTGAAV